MYDTIKALRGGKTIDLDGILLKQDTGEIGPGDLYVAERNSGPHLLTCDRVCRVTKCIYPTTPEYAFDVSECVKVCEA